jgi:hypothetical protein
MTTDDALIRVGESSALIRALSWPGRLLLAAWPDSVAAASTERWLAIPLHLRIRFLATTVLVAVVTHVALTGFRAPQPTFGARAAWVVVLLLLAATAVAARPIAAAWVDRRRRRIRARQDQTA